MTLRPRLLPLLLTLALAFVPATAHAAAPQRPELDGAASAILLDARDGSVILAKRPDDRRSMASTTKLMTALLTLERAKPSQVFPASSYRPAPVESQIHLRPGERMRVDDLFTGLMLESANDAAITLAEGIAGSRGAFVDAMNRRARELKLTNTRYTNPIGLDEGANYSSARDLATLARRLMRDRRFASVVDRPSATLRTGNRPRAITNRNDLVARYSYVKGVKTGHTRKAGYVLVGDGQNAAGAEVISVVMGEPSEAGRDSDSLALLQYGLKLFKRTKVLDADRPVASVPVDHRDEKAPLGPPSDQLVLTRQGDDRVRTTVDAPKSLGETTAGTRVGTITIRRGDEVVRRVPLVTQSAVPGAGPLRVITHALGGIVTAILLLVGVCAILVLVMNTRGRRRRRRADERRRALKRARAKAEAELQ